MPDPQKIFQSLIREAAFTKEVLGAGATQIRKANYASQGIYAQAFAGLSVGLERIGKLCLILDHYISNNGQFPDFSYLKNQIGHKLEAIHSRGEEIATKRKVKFQYLPSLSNPIHSSILRVLHAYADGDRYSNINVLIGAKQQDDPIAAWFRLVDIYIFKELISENAKNLISTNAKKIHEMAKGSVVFHFSETGDIIESFGEASFRTGMFKAVAPHRQLYTLQIIRYWVELLWHLQNEAQSLGHQEIPYFSEIFGGFYNSDSFFKSRKKWEF